MTPAAYFFDRNFPRPVARAIAGYERENGVARHLDDDSRFEPSTTDVYIIRTLAVDADRHWVLITQDKRILRNPTERAELNAAGLTFFYFDRAWMRMNLHEKAWRFLRAWPRVVETVGRHRGKVFEIEGVN